MSLPIKILQRQFDADLSLPGIHAVLNRIFAGRKIETITQIDTNLSLLSHYKALKDIDLATNILFSAIQNNEAIVIVGDFDADGATSSALAMKALKLMAVPSEKVNYLVPNRFEYGYGLTPEIVALAVKMKAELIITVDNGISSIDGVKFAKEQGIKVIVTDHHLPANELPIADAIVNPNQPGDQFVSKNLAGVGVIFYLMLSLRAKMNEEGWFKLKEISSPNMSQLLDLVALGTVADVVPLDHNNRILVSQGLKRIRAGLACAGINELLIISKRKIESTVSTDLAFSVGPKLNAAGRLKDMSLGIECLLAVDNQRAKKYAIQLNDLNIERREIEEGMKQQASVSLLETEQYNLEEFEEFGICLYNEDWHQGVIGILAARLKEKYHKPAIIFARADGKSIKGSARSIPGLHIRDLLDSIAAAKPKLIAKFGGHAMAAGLSLFEKDFVEFKQEYYKQLKLRLVAQDLEPILLTDGVLEENELSLEFAELLNQSGPWGQHFPEPVFEGEFYILDSKVVGGKHTKMSVQAVNSDTSIAAIAFNYLTESQPNPEDLAYLVYRLNVNEFNGWRTPQLIVENISDKILN